MHDDLASLLAFDRWANRRVFDACRKLTPQQYNAEPAPGWSSIRSTILHLTIATEGWIRGLTGEAVLGPLEDAALQTVDEAQRLLDNGYRIGEELIAKASPDWFDTPMTLRGGGRTAVLPPWVVLRHVVNHGTYHRGQLASKLKRFDIEQPPTDLIFWAFEQMAPAPLPGA